MAKKFLVLDGSHNVSDTVRVKKGDYVISDDDLAKLHGAGKFQFVEDVCCKEPEACTKDECKSVPVVESTEGVEASKKKTK